MRELSVDTGFYRSYSEARRQFLAAIGCDDSYRDPLAEFSERLVCQTLGGTLASSRVQKGFDLVTADGRKVQVKYLANPPGKWRNEHLVAFGTETDDYAVVFYEGLAVRGVIVFRRETIAEVCKALGKRHPNQECTLQLTQRNFNKLIASAREFETLGVFCYLSPVEGAEFTTSNNSHVAGDEVTRS